MYKYSKKKRKRKGKIEVKENLEKNKITRKVFAKKRR